MPLTQSGWDLSWLGSQAGYLEGTAFPTWAGNTVITSHVYLSDGMPGPFVDLAQLRWGDRVVIHAFGQSHIYQVRDLRYVRPNDASILPHEEFDWLTLITCAGYDQTIDDYRWRVVVRAVLVEIE